MDCLGGNLAAVVLWFSWLRRGRIGTLASGMKAFDTLAKPAKRFSVNWPMVFVFSAGCAMGTAISFPLPAPKTGAQDSKASRVPDPADGADEAGKTRTEETKEDAPNDQEMQEGTAATQWAPRDGDRAPPENDRE